MTSKQRRIRLVILWPCWTGYMDAGLATMFERYHLSVLLVQDAAHPEAPLDVMRLPAAARCEHTTADESFAALAARIEVFQPNLILVCSWDHPMYRKICRTWAGRAPRVMHMDNQWLGTLKQWGGVVSSPFFVRRLTDYAFVPGERQARFARRLGFDMQHILRSSLSGNTAAFAPLAELPLANRKAFLFVARLAPEKGVEVLIQAYRAYRAASDAPWSLIVCGTGRLAHLLDDVHGIEAHGFVQPSDLPAQFARAACLIMPSLFEPYAVAIHEAAIAGLGIICSEACGAGDDFVDSAGCNGQVVPTGDVAALTEAMLAMSRRPDAELEAVRQRSSELAAMVSPERWAESLASALAPPMAVD